MVLTIIRRSSISDQFLKYSKSYSTRFCWMRWPKCSLVLSENDAIHLEFYYGGEATNFGLFWRRLKPNCRIRSIVPTVS